jgi:hypothetical protein
MSDKKESSFMRELDVWSAGTVVGPLSQAHEEYRNTHDHARWSEAVQQIQKAIRAKVLESYRNGQRAPFRANAKGA